MSWMNIRTSTAIILSLSLSSFAGAEESDSLDLKKLEDKYWSAKDKDLAVVQNRTYSKSGRWFLSGSYGVLVNDAYYKGRMTNLALGYYRNEQWGLEFAYEEGNLQDNDSTDFFKSRYGIKPDTNSFKRYNSLNLLWVPIYAKMSFLDKKILYFDLQFAVGLGQLTYEQQHDPSQMSSTDQTTMAYNIDVTQQIFFHENWAIRLDVKNKFSAQKIDRWRTTGSQARELDGSKNQQDTTILLGITFFH